MNYENLKNEFIKLKKEELDYINNICRISSNKRLSESEKLEIYRTLKELKDRINEKLKQLRHEVYIKVEEYDKNPSEIIIEFDIDENYLSSFSKDYKERILRHLGINYKINKFQLSLSSILSGIYYGTNVNSIINNQKFIDEPIYLFTGYYDHSEDCYGPVFGDPDSYIFATYQNISSRYGTYSEYGDNFEIEKNKMNEFEKNKNIIKSEKYVNCCEVVNIFDQELLNCKNNTFNDCIISTQKIVREISITRSPEYKEKLLLEKINKLYEMVKGKLTKSEILYNGEFLDILRETHNLPNGKVVNKEKLIKNEGKNSVIIIALTQGNEYIITFQNRINNKIIAEFPAGYIEKNENVLNAAQRELMEETGYISDELSVIDQVYTSPGIDNSVSYIVFAANCLKKENNINISMELVKYDLFNEDELRYLIDNNIINGAVNKLAYYNLVCKFEDSNTTIFGDNDQVIKRFFKRQRKRDASL